MALEHRAELAQVRKLLLGEEAVFRQHAVERGRGVALAEHEAVAVRVMRVLRLDVHHIAIECDEDFHGGERSARMAGAGLGQHADDVPAHLRALRPERIDFHDVPPEPAAPDGPLLSDQAE